MMFRDPNSLYLDDLREFYRNEQAVYYACRKVNANTELVCDGLAIETGGNSPNDECSQIVNAACRAFEDVLGFGTTKTVTFFHDARTINGETTLAIAPIERDEEWEDERDDQEGDRRWIERSDLPDEAEALLKEADEAFDAAYEAAVTEVEADHARKADEWVEQLIAEGDCDGLQYVIDDCESCASEAAREKAAEFVAQHEATNDA